ncbi:hypothetical protein OYB12_10985 [Escherichia coli]|uniref:hypothetical protein n=2 Tax=Escherichia coli TaxID=562 RepID=UPI000DA59DDF|nr:hypothetical protein [Escherichia coli]EFJ3030436.1 hypothetical protein [Escherichia coli]EGK2853096.1 hypothetical protein [Escherichia coli]EHH6675430.1 hypothetical protein [Escherichia coli]EHI6968584.1 hypothetical protein [Escherichia coli]EHM4320711.1 hypothetical protein [Escherichia coli]
MTKKQLQSMKSFLSKEISRLESIEQESSKNSFVMDENDAYMLKAYRMALAALEAKPAAWLHFSEKIAIPVITTSCEVAESWKSGGRNVTPLYPAPYHNNEAL